MVSCISNHNCIKSFNPYIQNFSYQVIYLVMVLINDNVGFEDLLTREDKKYFKYNIYNTIYIYIYYK